MSEFIGRFTLPEDTTTGKSYYTPIKKQVINLFKEGNTKEKCYFPRIKVNHLLTFYLYLINKSLDIRKIKE